MSTPYRHYNDLSALGADAPNIDHATGIRVGWISQHTPMAEALDDITTQGEDLSYTAAVEEAKASIVNALRPVLDDLSVLPYGLNAEREKLSAAKLAEISEGVWEAVEQDFNDHYESDGATYHYERDGYVIEWSPNGSLACLAVIRSPFYTWCAFGSPCIPNAGDLDTPRGKEEEGIRAYCLGADWFEGEEPPYDVYSVVTHELEKARA